MGINDDLKQALNIDKNKMSVKMLEAPTIRKNEHSTYAVPTKFSVVQADLIYIKEESQGYKYILTVVDVASRKMDAIPLKGRTHKHVIAGFEKVWKRKNIIRDQVKHLVTDPGSEFRNGVFHDYMEDQGITVRHTMNARKNQTGIVEYYNGIIMKNLGLKMTSEELDNDHDYSDWAQDLEKIVEVLNKGKYEKESKISDFIGQPKIGKNEKLLEVGTVVHVKLQQPINHRVDDKKDRLHGGFRAGDLRFEKDTTKIKLVVINPKQPIRYMVEKYNNVSFLRKELLVNTGQPQNVPVQQNVPVKQNVQVKQNVPVQPIQKRVIPISEKKIKKNPNGIQRRKAGRGYGDNGDDDDDENVEASLPESEVSKIQNVPNNIASRTRSKTANAKYPNMV
jgi:hypothetical protein